MTPSPATATCAARILEGCAAFSCFLLLLVGGSLVIQSIGYWLGLSLVGSALWIALVPSLLFTYGRCFPYTPSHGFIAVALTILLVLLGIHCQHSFDFSADGMGYQQAAAQDIASGWNPIEQDSASLWQNIYPSGVWAVEASIAKLYGSIETTRMLQCWWLMIALPLLLYGMYQRFPALHPLQGILLGLCVLSTTVTVQILTHYVDAMVYLSGLTFIAGLCIYGTGKDTRDAQLGTMIMVLTLCFIINTKLSGIYHGCMLCSIAILIVTLRNRRVPWRLLSILTAAGLFAVLCIGYRPYVTSMLSYGALFPGSTEAFSGAQRPSSFDGLAAPVRFLYSLFCTTGGEPHLPAVLKWPWTINASELYIAGTPDARTGGYGPLFAVGLLVSLALLLYAKIRALPLNTELLILGLLCLLFSAAFPQGWWLRYVPFGFAAPFFFACAISVKDNHYARAGLCALILFFAVNIVIAGAQAYSIFAHDQQRFSHLIAVLKQHGNSAYLVPPLPNYERYNHAYMPLERRLQANGLDVSVRPSPTPCPHKVETYSEFRVCY